MIELKHLLFPEEAINDEMKVSHIYLCIYFKKGLIISPTVLYMIHIRIVKKILNNN
jgi:hypothetical protein